MKGMSMGLLKWAIFFALIALAAGALGLSNISAGASTVARFLLFLFLALAIIFIVLFMVGASSVGQ
jgi:uncharacterized membrane protein YtjA (UPF0391 family)